jgi:hydrogenase/urease accessory protein HupE
MKRPVTIQTRWLRVSAILLVAILLPARAEAHLNSTGLGPVYDGVAHFLLTPEDFIPVLALALLAGQRGAAYGRRALFVLPVAWMLGAIAGLTGPLAGSAALACISFLLLGGLLAADAKVSLHVLTVLAALVGLSHGYLNGAAMGRPEDAALVLAGLAAAVFVLVALAAALVVPLRQQWARIAVRVVGSWIVASGLLVLGWAARSG